MVVKHPSLPITSEGLGPATSPALAATAAPASKTTKSPPSELLVMGRIERLIEQLPDTARGRVIRWAYEKWNEDNGEG